MTPTTAVSGPSGRRVSDIFGQLKAEYEAAVQHCDMAKQTQLELEHKVQAQVVEMALMQQILTTLEATHRRICHEYDHEVAQLRRELETRDNATATIEHLTLMTSTKRLRTTARREASRDGEARTQSAVSQSDSPYSKQVEQRTSSPPPRPSPHQLESSKPNGLQQTSIKRTPSAEASSHPVIAAVNAAATLLQEPTKQNHRNRNDSAQSSSTSTSNAATDRPPSPPVELRGGAVVPVDQFSAVDRQSPSNSKIAELNWKCTYPSKSVLPSMTPQQEHERPAAELHHSMDLKSAVCTVRFSGDGAMVAAGCHKSAQVFDVKTGEVNLIVSSPSNAGQTATGTPEEDDGHVRAVCFSPDSTTLIVGMPHNTIRTWDIASKTEGPAMTGHKAGIYALDCVNNVVVSGSGDRTVRLWDARSGQCKKIFDREAGNSGPLDGVTSVALSPNGGHLLASGSLDKIVCVWDTETGQLLDRFECHSDSVYSVAFSPDGKQLVSGSFDCTIMLWDVGAQGRTSTRPRMVLQGHRELVLSVAYTPDGRWLLSSSKDRSVRFWDPRSTPRSVLTLTGHRNSVIGVASSTVSPYFATASGDGVAALWKYRCESL